MRADGTRTPAEQRKALALKDAEIATVKAALDTLTATWAEVAPVATVSDALSDAWNGLHDAVTRMEAERREIDLNRRTVLTETDRLIAANID